MSIDDILTAQAGVISRRQALEAGARDLDIRRRLRRREWKTVHPGVYVDHTGPLTWIQRAWAAVLYHWPAYLEGQSALHVARVRGYEPKPGASISVLVDRTRSVKRRAGIAVYQAVRANTLTHAELSPPRQTIEHALLSVAARGRGLDASVATLADAVQDGRTTAGRLVGALDQRTKLRHRGVLRLVLADVDEGVRSVLEHRYFRTVEAAHGLPRGLRQQLRPLGKRRYPDVDYEGYGVLVHLDGRVGHSDTLNRRTDFERDLAGFAVDIISVHVDWGQVLDPCSLAAAVARLLRQRGWNGQPTQCGPICTALQSPAASFSVQTP